MSFEFTGQGRNLQSRKTNPDKPPRPQNLRFLGYKRCRKHSEIGENQMWRASQASERQVSSREAKRQQGCGKHSKNNENRTWQASQASEPEVSSGAAKCYKMYRKHSKIIEDQA